MANTKGIRAGKAFVELFADDTPLARALRASQNRLENWGKSVTAAGKATFAAGAAALVPLGLATKSFVDQGSALDDMANRTGAGVESLATLGYAAERTGASIEDLEKGLVKTQKTVVEAGQGGKGAATALGRLGLTASALAALSPEDQFREIARSISAIPDPAQRTAAAMAVWGKSGAALLPLANEFGLLEQRARDLGVAMSEEDVSAAAQLGDSLDDLKAVAKSATAAIGSALAPALTTAANAAITATAGIVKWIRENKQAVVIVATVALGLAAVGSVLLVVGGLFSALAAIAGAAITVLSGLSVIVGALGAAIGLLLSPLGLVIAAVAALVGGFLYFSGVGGDAADAVMEKWKDAYDAIAAAQEAGAKPLQRPGVNMLGLASAAKAGAQTAAGFVDVRSAEGFSSVLKSLRPADNSQARMADALQKMLDGQGKQLDAAERTADAVEDLEVGDL